MKKNVFVSVSTDPINDFQEIVEYAKEMQGSADMLHCDVMDGVFVEKKTITANHINNINQNSLIALDVHLMCQEPLKIVEDYLNSGANIVTVHYEAFEDKNDILKAVKLIKKAGALAGLSFKPDTEIKEIKMFLHDFDIILVMSVFPGASGQKFIKESLERIKILDGIRKENDYRFKIEVDGGVNESNASSIISAGADILVSGSYVYKTANRREAIEKLKGLEKKKRG